MRKSFEIENNGHAERLDPVRILVAESNLSVAQPLARRLGQAGYTVTGARTVDDANDCLRTGVWDVLIIDLDLPRSGGLSVLESLSPETEPPVIVVLASGHRDPDAEIAHELGAQKVFDKPVDPDRLCSWIGNALGTATIRRRANVYALRATNRTEGPVFVSRAMRQAIAYADRVASTPSSCALITGESGVGKELIASRIHRSSRRKAGPFVRVNLAAIPESMIEAELFGAVKGAFTGASHSREGLFGTANGGTLLLDELCEFRIDLQSKLLRALQERRFFPVGADRERRVNLRILAATNRDPRKAVEEGKLREDLFYRLSTVVIHVPPLRERTDDIIPLANEFMELFAAEFERTHLRFSPAAERALLSHDWRGNVRELKNAIERAVMFAEGDTICGADLGIATSTPDLQDLALGSDRYEGTCLSLETARRSAIEQVERAHIRRVLDMASGSQTKAAELLNVSRSTLWQKMKLYGL